jgi:hypothetical protein
MSGPNHSAASIIQLGGAVALVVPVQIASRPFRGREWQKGPVPGGGTGPFPSFHPTHLGVVPFYFRSGPFWSWPVSTLSGLI